MKVICVDLDQTLVFQDTSLLLWLKLWLHKPWFALKATYLYLSKRSAKAKALMVQHITLDVTQLPYNLVLLDWLKKQRQLGHPIWLVTGTHRQTAKAIANHLGIFAGVLASDASTNLVSTQKALVLQEKFREFIYIGDHKQDLDVWAVASETGLVAPTGKNIFKRSFDYHFDRPTGSFISWYRFLSIPLVSIPLSLWLFNLLLPSRMDLTTCLQLWGTATLGSIGMMLLAHLCHIDPKGGIATGHITVKDLLTLTLLCFCLTLLSMLTISTQHNLILIGYLIFTFYINKRP